MLEDVITTLIEDVLDFDNLFTAEGCTSERRHRALRIHNTLTSHTTTSKDSGNLRRRRALRKTHPDARSRRAPRAHHLRYNHFTRPPRRRHLTDACASTELLDGLSIKGGYDGTQIFFKLELDVSKGAMSDLRDVILKPIRLLSETDFMQDLSHLFSDGASIVDSVFDNIDADISFSAGAHLGATGKNSLGSLIKATHPFTHTWHCAIHNSRV